MVLHSWGFLDHTQRSTKVGRTPLDEWSVRRRDLYLTTQNAHNRQIRTHNPTRQAAVDLRLRTRGHWDRRGKMNYDEIVLHEQKNNASLAEKVCRLLLLLLLLSLSSSSSSPSPLCKVFILIFLRQTMSLVNRVLQLFCCYYSWCLYR